MLNVIPCVIILTCEYSFISLVRYGDSDAAGIDGCSARAALCSTHFYNTYLRLPLHRKSARAKAVLMVNVLAVTRTAFTSVSSFQVVRFQFPK